MATLRAFHTLIVILLPIQQKQIFLSFHSLLWQPSLLGGPCVILFLWNHWHLVAEKVFFYFLLVGFFQRWKSEWLVETFALLQLVPHGEGQQLKSNIGFLVPTKNCSRQNIHFCFFPNKKHKYNSSAAVNISQWNIWEQTELSLFCISIQKIFVKYPLYNFC